MNLVVAENFCQIFTLTFRLPYEKAVTSPRSSFGIASADDA